MIRLAHGISSAYVLFSHLTLYIGFTMSLFVLDPTAVNFTTYHLKTI